MVPPLAVALLVSAAVYAFFLDGLMKRYLENLGTRLNGAVVETKSFKTSLLSGTVEIEGIQIAHHVQPMKNLLEIEKIKISFAVAPIFQKKLIVEDMKVEGIRYGTERLYSGLMPRGLTTGDRGPGLIDRVATGFFAEIRNDLSDNPLRHLARLSTGIDLNSKMDAVRGKLQTNARLIQHRKQLKSLMEKWERQGNVLTSSSWLADKKREAQSPGPNREKLRQEVAAEIKRLQEMWAPYAKELSVFTEETSDIDTILEQDIALVQRTLGLPRTDFTDLTRLMLGPKLLNYLERLAYWIDLSRRRMPQGHRQGQVVEVAQERSRGTSIHFGKMSTYPAFLLKHGTFASTANEAEKRGEVSGFFDAITSDPPIYGKPARVEIDADFPATEVRGAKIGFDVDHTGESTHEKFTFAAEALPLRGFVLYEAPDVKVSLARGRLRVEFEASFDENRVQAKWVGKVENAGYDIVSPYKQTEQVLREILEPVYEFTVDGRVKGTFDDLDLQITSEMGKRLAEGIRREFRHPLAAVDDNLRRTLIDQVDSLRQEVFQHFRELRARVVTVIDKNMSELAAIEATLSAPPSRAVSSAPKKKK